MEYRVQRVYNNNVVLVRMNEQELILVGKGVGFGKKANEIINFDPTVHKVYYETQVDAEGISKNDLQYETIKKITSLIISKAESRFGEMNTNSLKVISEHIQFALERLSMGIVIENPFIEQIKALYRDEFAIATYGAKLIYESLGINIGQEEMGFIALHIYSAKKNNTLKETMKVTRVYTTCKQILEEQFKIDLDMENIATKQFFRNLKYLMYMYQQGNVLDKVAVSVKKSSQSYKVALKIKEALYKEKVITFNDSYLTYLAVEVDKLLRFVKA